VEKDQIEFRERAAQMGALIRSVFDVRATWGDVADYWFHRIACVDDGREVAWQFIVSFTMSDDRERRVLSWTLTQTP
jgi:hypothetical protein